MNRSVLAAILFLLLPAASLAQIFEADEGQTIQIRLWRIDLPQCSDGIDNDGDGLADYPEDPGCESPVDDDEATPTPSPAPSPAPAPLTPAATPSPAVLPLFCTAADFNGDGRVNIRDLSIMLYWWEKTGPETAPYDLNNDGAVDIVDASILFYCWTT